jgi:hypothetical protein
VPVEDTAGFCKCGYILVSSSRRWYLLKGYLDHEWHGFRSNRVDIDPKARVGTKGVLT